MVFSSLLFLFLFLPLTLLLYACSPRKLKNLILFLMSLVFYAWGEPVYVALMLVSTVTDYAIGLLLERTGNSPGKRKLLLIGSVVVNLGVLGFFKYYAFLARSLEALTGISLPDWDPPLPIGISFYTFQTLSYTIDVYRREVAAQRSFIRFGCFVALFPQLIAGPIVRYREIEADLNRHRTIISRHLVEGSRLFLVGLGKKVLLANNIGALWDEIHAMPASELTAGTAWLGLVAFAMQIYFDFSGYSDMARGLGRMFGFQFPINFNYPYISQSITEFWRRWHMTLGSWFREYVYIPLGGNRVGRWKLFRNIFVVWLLTGLWHGASWNFVWWGLYFAIVLAAEKGFVLSWLRRVPRVIRHLYACTLILLGWVLFAVESPGAMGDYFCALIGLRGGGYDVQTLYGLTSYGGVLVLCVIGSLPVWKGIAMKMEGPVRRRLYDGAMAAACMAILLLSIAYLVDSTYNPFLYFRF